MSLLSASAGGLLFSKPAIVINDLCLVTVRVFVNEQLYIIVSWGLVFWILTSILCKLCVLTTDWRAVWLYVPM